MNASTTAVTKPEAQATYPSLGLLQLGLSAVRFVAMDLRMRRDRAALNEMPDHLLRDIGLARSDITRVVPRWPR